MIRTSNMNTENNIAIVCITDNGKNLAVKIQKKLKEGKIYFVKKKNNEESQEVCNIGNDTYTMKNDKLELRQQNSKNIIRIEQKLKDFIPTIFNKYRYIVFIMATGIVVRTIAPLIQSKFQDPAVIVTDEKGTNVISLLSGHMGGANEMALYISHLIESNPVITTATDVNNKSSLDMIAKRLDGYIENFRDNVLKVNSMIVNNKPVGLFIDGDYNIDTRGFTILKYEDMLNLDKRNNEEIKLPKRKVTIKELKLISDITYEKEKTKFKIKCHVSKGTYIRSLIEDIATNLNTIGTMENLKRTKQGNFQITSANTIQDIENNKFKIYSIEEILEKFYKIEMTDDLYFKIKNGSIIKNNYNHNIVAFTKNDKVIAIYKEYSKDKTLLKPWKMFL